MTGEDKMNRIFVYIGIIAGLLLGGGLSVEAQKKPLDMMAESFYLSKQASVTSKLWGSRKATRYNKPFGLKAALVCLDAINGPVICILISCRISSRICVFSRNPCSLDFCNTYACFHIHMKSHKFHAKGCHNR